MAVPKILVIPGALRAKSHVARLAALAAKQLTLADTDVTRISLADYPLPIYDAGDAAESAPPNNAVMLKRLLSAHQGVFIASPTNSHSSPWRDPVNVTVGYTPGVGAISNVLIFADDALIGRTVTSLSYTNAALGVHAIRAVGQVDNGTTVTSAVVLLTIAPRPAPVLKIDRVAGPFLRLSWPLADESSSMPSMAMILSLKLLP